MASHILNNGFLKQIGEPTNSLANLSRFITRSNNKKGDPSKTKDVSYSVESLVQSVISLISNNPITEFHLMPNFNFGYFYPSTGWVAKLDRKLIFSHDFLMGEEFFRCISIVEINKAIEDHEFFRRICLTCIPTKASDQNCIGMQDNDGSGWTPVFSPRGNALGYFTFKDHDDATNESVERHFLICDNSLPDYTLNLFQNYLIKEGYRNSKLASSNINDPNDNPSTVEDIISDFSRLGTLRSCAYEQNRRLLAILISCLQNQGIHALHTSIENHVPRHLPHEDSFPTDEPYRPGRTKKPLDGEASDSAKLLTQTLDNWPPGAPIYPFSVDPATDYPIGRRINKLYEVAQGNNGEAIEAQSALNALEKSHPWFRFIRKPETLTPLVETMYNTFERELDGSIVWRSNNTSCQNPKGVIKKNPLSMGYTVINPSFCISQTNQPWVIREHLNSHPVIDPYEPDETKHISDELLKKFFSRESPPNQLKGSFLRDNELENDPRIRSVLYPVNLVKIQMEPKFVFLSSGWQSKPQFEIQST